MARLKANPKAARRRKLMREARNLTLGVRPTEPKFQPPVKERRGKKTGLTESALRRIARRGGAVEKIEKLKQGKVEF